MGKLFLSHRLDLLANHLAKELAEERGGLFSPRIIVVPTHYLKQWVSIEIAKNSKEQGIAGYRTMTWQEAVQAFLTPSGFAEIYFSLYTALQDRSTPELASYLGDSERRRVELAERLTRLFIRYGTFCPSLFLADPNTEDWQKKLIQKLFVSGDLRLPVQMKPASMPPIHCFGCDFIPPPIWHNFNIRAVYLFSPCLHYWEDLCTDRQRRLLGRYWKRKGASEMKRAELDAYLHDAPPLLSNWGRAGRETLKTLDSLEMVARHSSEWAIQEDYRPLEKGRDGSLQRLRKKLLEFNASKEEGLPADPSVQLAKTGSSLLKELEHVRATLLRFVSEEGLQYSDIVVLAPDIQPYASLIPFVFFDLPFRIFGLEIGSKSNFYQGMLLLFQLDSEFEALGSLLENPSFARARGWDSDFLEQIRGWLSVSGEEALLDRFIYLSPEVESPIPNGAADALEQWIELARSLRADVASLRQHRTLADWSTLISALVGKYFFIDSTDEADAAAWGFFQQTLKDLARADKQSVLFPFSSIQVLFKRPIPEGQMHASHLHAIRFASLNEGTAVPCRALFLIGMDEERFPRRSTMFSLDLLKEEKIYSYEPTDQDRYLFLQALFSPADFLHISYSHLSSDGNPVNPSPLVDELSRSLDAPIQENQSEVPIEKRESVDLLSWPLTPCCNLPTGEKILSLFELSRLSRHPWEFYLHKQYGIRVPRSDEPSFSFQKAKLLKASLHKPFEKLARELPKGICGEAIKLDLEETFQEWKELMECWGLQIEPLSLFLSCSEPRRGKRGREFPALSLDLGEGLRIRVTGELRTYSTSGFIHTGSDNLEGLLKVWPECLATLIASGRREIYCLKTGKVREVEKPEEAMRNFLVYFFLAETAPSPLLASWADPLLRKEVADFEEKIQEKRIGKKEPFEDPISDWVLDRICLSSGDAWFESWVDPLRRSFTSLTALYPLKGKNETV